MAFTSWSVLKTAVLDAIADGSILTKSYSIGSRAHTFRDMSDVIEFIKFCDSQIKGASGSTAYAEFKRPNQGA